MVPPSEQRLVFSPLRVHDYVRKEVIYSGRKRYEIMHGDSSTRNSWRNHWL